MKKIWRITFMMFASLSFVYCQHSPQKAGKEQQVENAETANNTDTLRLIVVDKELTKDASFVSAIIINPTMQDVYCDAVYTIEYETDGQWQTVPFPKNFGFVSVLTPIAAGDTTTIYGHLAQLRLAPDHYRLCKPIVGKTLSDDFYIR